MHLQLIRRPMRIFLYSEGLIQFCRCSTLLTNTNKQECVQKQKRYIHVMEYKDNKGIFITFNYTCINLNTHFYIYCSCVLKQYRVSLSVSKSTAR